MKNNFRIGKSLKFEVEFFRSFAFQPADIFWPFGFVRNPMSVYAAKKRAYSQEVWINQQIIAPIASGSERHETGFALTFSIKTTFNGVTKVRLAFDSDSFRSKLF